MAISSTPCADGSPFMLLGDGLSAPILNYNLPQKTCYHGNGYFPLSIPEDYFDTKFTSAPTGNPWDAAEAMTLDEIVSTLRGDILNTAKPVLLQNSALLKRQKDLIRFTLEDSTKYIAPQKEPETYVVGDSNLRVSRLQNAPGEREMQITNVARVNHLSVVPTLPPENIQIAGYTLEYIAAQVSNGNIPSLRMEFGGKISLHFLVRPTLNPRITIVEHYKTCAYLGDYGAGKTLRTFSLLPGEKTTITVKSFKDKTSSYIKSSSTNTNEFTSTYYADDETSTSVKSENILDSFSQYSADQLQSYIESMEGEATGEQNSQGVVEEVGEGGGSQGGFNLFGLYNFQTGSGNTSNAVTSNAANAVRETHMSTLETALESSVSESGQYRDVEINTTTGNVQNSSSGGSAGGNTSISVAEQESIMVRSGEDAVTIRQLQNINYSRVLNFVFRQLLQEYVVLTYLNDVSIVFSTGFGQQRKVVKLSQLDALLNELFPDPAQQDEVRNSILIHFCNVANYQGTLTAFAEKVDQTLSDCVNGTTLAPVSYWRKVAGLSDSYTSGGLTINVPGIITSVSSHILRTDSVIADSLLGQGEALDCYNTRLQEEAVKTAELRNDRFTKETTQENDKIGVALEALQQIVGPEARTEAYKKMFGECCTEDLLLLLNQSSGTTP